MLIVFNNFEKKKHLGRVELIRLVFGSRCMVTIKKTGLLIEI